MKPRPNVARHLAAAAFLLLACALSPTEARADGVVMTGGTGTSTGSGVVMNFANPDGTQLRLSVGRIGIQNPFDDCLGRCLPGQFMNLSWRAFGSDVGGGPGAFGGMSGNVSIGGGFFSVHAQSILIPTDGAASYTFVVPFSAHGTDLLLYFGGGALSRPPDFNIDLFAQGLATIIITRGANGSYLPTSGTFQVNAPVPEPATLLLLGTGLAGAAAARRRRRQRQC